MNISDTVIDWAHGIGNTNVHNKQRKSKKKSKKKSIIKLFTTFCHRTMVYRTKKNMKDNVRVRLDLTKKLQLNYFCKQTCYFLELVKFSYADENCRPKIKWEDESVYDDFFYSLNGLKSFLAVDV